MFNHQQVNKFPSRVFLRQFFAIALSSTCIILNSYSLKAQTNSSEAILLEGIQLKENSNWNFSSEEESHSVRDNIKELGEYDISETESIDTEFVEEDKRWGNKGDVEDYSIETEIYEY